MATENISAEALAKAVAAAADSKKATDIVIMNMAEVTTTTDYFVICTGGSTRQTKAIADAIEEELALQGRKFLRREGYDDGSWILLDYGDCVAHVFTAETRSYYALEDLWQKAASLRYEQ